MEYSKTKKKTDQNKWSNFSVVFVGYYHSFDNSRRKTSQPGYIVVEMDTNFIIFSWTKKKQIMNYLSVTQLKPFATQGITL